MTVFSETVSFCADVHPGNIEIVVHDLSFAFNINDRDIFWYMLAKKTVSLLKIFKFLEEKPATNSLHLQWYLLQGGVTDNTPNHESQLLILLHVDFYYTL